MHFKFWWGHKLELDAIAYEPNIYLCFLSMQIFYEVNESTTQTRCSFYMLFVTLCKYSVISLAGSTY